jgi:putative effector of murein hydrolase LrgA (UPF0299 family)
MQQTLTSVAILIFSFFLTWLINRLFKLNMPANLMAIIAVLLWGLLQCGWILWPLLGSSSG